MDKNFNGLCFINLNEFDYFFEQFQESTKEEFTRREEEPKEKSSE